MERPIPQTEEEEEKLRLIDAVCLDDAKRHCLPRVLLERRDDLTPCGIYGSPCHARGWCFYRQTLFEKFSARTIAQAKLIEIEEWMLGVRNEKPETYVHALTEFAERKYGNGAIFAYAWDELKIRDLGELARLCVYSVLDNSLILEATSS